MLRLLATALAGGLALEALASPVASPAGALAKRTVPDTHVLHERHQAHWQRKWARTEKVRDDVVLPMRIGLKQQNLKAGHDKLMEISTPGSASYGQHMTADEVIAYFAPHQSSVDAVIDWLVSAGIEEGRIGQSVNKQWIQFDATAAEASELLYTDYYVWEHEDSGSRDMSCEEYHVPAAVREHIDYVTPGTRMRTRKTRRDSTEGLVRRAGGADRVSPQITELPGLPEINSTSCDTYVVAECTRVQYGIPNGTTAVSGNELGIFEDGDHYSREDLDIFFSSLYPYIPNGTYPEERLVDGAVGAVEDDPALNISVGLESSLDFDSSWPLIWPQKTVLFQEDDEWYEEHGTAGFWNTFLDAIDGSYCNYSAYGETGDCTEPACADAVYPDPHPGGYKGQLQCGVYEPTNVISISYAGDEWAWPDFYMKRQCNEWMKLVLQGTTVVMSSGDSGVGDISECPSAADGYVFAPYFASTCPYVLSVGSTEWDLYPNQTKATPWEVLNEVATYRFPSGGGFSNVFPRPSYQADAVATYLDVVAPTLPFTGYNVTVTDGDFSNVTSGVYNVNGRAYPDVAAVGDRQVVMGGETWWLVGGTSLSSPVWGAVLTLINEQRLTAGKSTVGFIHPTIYAHPEAFRDITNGTNAGCDTTGFVASTGWDPVTGLGSPNFPVLLDVLLNA